jgi:hypothetical protein
VEDRQVLLHSLVRFLRCSGIDPGKRGLELPAPRAIILERWVRDAPIVAREPLA